MHDPNFIGDTSAISNCAMGRTAGSDALAAASHRERWATEYGVGVSDLERERREDVTISVERMMRFCYLAQMQFDCAACDTKALPLHLTRFGTLVLETASFLYSLFEDRPDSINLLKVWRGFDHPFGKSCGTA